MQLTYFNEKLFSKFYVIISVLFAQVQIFGQAIVINEFMASNSTTIADEKGNYNDWIELYNASNEDVNLDGFALSDDISDYGKWKFPNVVIQSNNFLLIFASGDDVISPNQQLHTNFKIKQTGEPLFLTNSDGLVLSFIEPVFVPNDQSFACITDGNEKMTIADKPTPNASNNGFGGIYCSHQSGFYTANLNLNLFHANSNYKIYYTLNGQTPTTNSKLYTGPITITNNQQKPLNFSLIPTTPLQGEAQLNNFIWKQPTSVYNCNVLRYAVFKNDSLQGKIYTKQFFVDREIERRYTLPIITIATDSLNLFDYETGIYVPGKRFDENGFNWWPEGNYLNRGIEWERAIHISYFENDGLLAFETDAGMRMRGFGSTSNPQKSFITYFRKEYGRSEIEHQIFKNASTKVFKRLIFRNSGNDFLHTHFRDALLQTIIEPMPLDLQAFQPSVVFINGEYWGIHNIREKYDKHYFKYKYDIDENDVNILGVCGEVEEGNNNDYNELIEFIETNDLSYKENYDYVRGKIDISNFINFQIAEIYYANYDWPCNNFKIWKDNSKKSKWKFLIYDLDYSFGFDNAASYATNSIEHATSLSNTWPHCNCSNLIFRKLLQNNEFKSQFLEEFDYALKNTFNSQRILAIIDDFEQKYLPEIEEHIERWAYPSNVATWKQEVEKLREFATERPCYISETIKTYFDLPTFESSCLRSENNNTLTLYPNPSDGNFTIINNAKNSIETGEIEIVNSLGEIVYAHKNVSLNLHEEFYIKVNNSLSGIFFLRYKSKNYTEIKKIIIAPKK